MTKSLTIAEKFRKEVEETIYNMNFTYLKAILYVKLKNDISDNNLHRYLDPELKEILHESLRFSSNK
jgi:hypothetical protein